MKRTRVKGRSDRNVVEGEIRKAMREQIRECQLGPVLKHLGVPLGSSCRGRVQGLHERRKAGQGGSKINPANLLGACNLCNDGLESLVGIDRDKVNDSILVVRPSDDEWTALGRKMDLYLDMAVDE